jgi:2,5-diketo-D-gluconate reductase B
MEKIQTQGVAIPRLGFGTFRMPGGGCQPVVESALGLGFRHIDNAAMYENEDAVGAAIASSGVKREDLFVTTKVWHDQLGRGTIRKAFDTSLSKLKLDYVDMYMVQWPSADMDLPAVLEEMMTIKADGGTRAIGVCNFNMKMIRQAVEEVRAPIAALQIEYHPFMSQARMLDYVRGKGIPLTAYAPLAQGRAAQDETLQKIGDRRLGGPDRDSVAARSAGRHRDPEGAEGVEPAFEPRGAEGQARRRGSIGDRGASQGPALRQAAVRAGLDSLRHH